MKRFVQLLMLFSLLGTHAVSLAQSGPTVITPDNADQLVLTGMIGRGAIHDMAWSMDGSTLAVATTLGVWLYDTDHLEAEPIYVQSPALWVNSVAYSPDGTLLAFDAGTNTIGLIHPDTGEEVTFLEVQPGPGLLDWVEWTAADTLIVYNSIGDGFTVDVLTGNAEPAPNSSPPSRPQVLQITSVTGVDAKGWLEGQNSAITVIGPQDMYFLEGFHTGIGGLAFSPNDPDILAFGTLDGLVWWWDTTTQSYLRSTSPPTGAVNAVAFSGDGTVLAAAASQYPWNNPTIPAAVRLFDAATGTFMRALLDTTNGLWTLAYSADGTRIATAGGSGNFTIRVWTLGDNADSEPQILEAHEDAVRALAYTRDDRSGLFSGSDDGTVRLWDPGGIERGVYEGNGQPVSDLALSPDGSRLAVTQGAEVWLWEVATGQLLQVFECADNTPITLNSVTFSPDSALLAAGSMNHHIILWDMATGEQLTDLSGPSYHGVQDLAFSPDGTLLASASLDGAIWLWQVP